MKEIILSQHNKRVNYKKYIVMVDDDDYEWLNHWKWYVWKNNRGNMYAKRMIKGKDVSMHRVILGIENSPNILGDHEDGNGLNNQRYNLRKCDVRQNSQNRRKGSNKSSIYKGVGIDRTVSNGIVYKYWKSRISINGKTITLGKFPYTKSGEVLAAQEYDNSAKKYFGKFANLNFKQASVEYH